MKIQKQLIIDSQNNVDIIYDQLFPRIREALMQAYVNGFKKALTLIDEEKTKYINGDINLYE